MRVLITGATGLIGQEIVKQCHSRSIEVNYLTTRKGKLSNSENYKGFYWNPSTSDIDKDCFLGVDAIIHLAGATVSKRWTASYKEDILSSRKETTRLLINSLKGESHSVKHVVSASAIGIYPDSLIGYYEESHKPISDTFLGKVVKLWEDEVDVFSSIGVRVTKIRIGLVLSNKGGALPQMARPIKYGIGAAFGSGEQWQSWIHIEDLAAMFLYTLENKLSGVYNGVAPNPVTNTALTKTIAKVLSTPIFLPNMPKFAMQLALGEMHTLLFESQRVSSNKIESKGFNFRFNYIEPALKDLL